LLSVEGNLLQFDLAHLWACGLVSLVSCLIISRTSQIGSVIRNPEVSGLVPHLLAAIADPNGATRPALDVLLETVFVNTIDAASLVRGGPASPSLCHGAGQPGKRGKSLQCH
jgi:hypothetical protein